MYYSQETVYISLQLLPPPKKRSQVLILKIDVYENFDVLWRGGWRGGGAEG